MPRLQMSTRGSDAATASERLGGTMATSSIPPPGRARLLPAPQQQKAALLQGGQMTVCNVSDRCRADSA